MRLQAFLYLLMRDYLPTGDVCKIIQELGELKDFNFTAKELAALAKRYAEEIEQMAQIAFLSHMCYNRIIDYKKG